MLSIKYDNSEALETTWMVTDKRRRDMSQYNDGFEFPCHPQWCAAMTINVDKHLRQIIK